MYEVYWSDGYDSTYIIGVWSSKGMAESVREMLGDENVRIREIILTFEYEWYQRVGLGEKLFTVEYSELEGTAVDLEIYQTTSLSGLWEEMGDRLVVRDVIGEKWWNPVYVWARNETEARERFDKWWEEVNHEEET